LAFRRQMQTTRSFVTPERLMMLNVVTPENGVELFFSLTLLCNITRKYVYYVAFVYISTHSIFYGDCSSDVLQLKNWRRVRHVSSLHVLHRHCYVVDPKSRPLASPAMNTGARASPRLSVISLGHSRSIEKKLDFSIFDHFHILQVCSSLMV